MVKKYISNDVLFTFDQLIESVKLFSFILLAPKLLSPEDAATVITISSGAFLVQLVLSSYLTQYLMVTYNKEPRGEWLFLFLKISIPFFCTLCFFGEFTLAYMFLSLLLNEYFKRLMYYSDSSLISSFANSIVFVLFIVLVFSISNLSSEEYVVIYLGCSLIYFFFLILCNLNSFFSRSENKVLVNIGLLSFGNKVVVSLVLYWAISQGVYYFSEYFNLSSQDVIDLKLTQTIFGLSAIFAAIFETVLLKRMVKGDGAGNKKIMLVFPIAIALCLVNLTLIFVVSKYFYYIAISTFTIYILLFQFVFIINRIPCAILKKNNLIGWIAVSYLVGFIFGFVLSVALANQYDPKILVSACMFIAHALSSVIMYLCAFIHRDKGKCIIT